MGQPGWQPCQHVFILADLILRNIQRSSRDHILQRHPGFFELLHKPGCQFCRLRVGSVSPPASLVKPQRHHRQAVGESHPGVGLQQLGVQHRSHVGIHVGWFHPRPQRPLHLGIQFHQGSQWIALFLQFVRSARKISFCVDQPRNRVHRGERFPTVCFPFAGKGGMDAQIGLRVIPGESRGGEEIRAGHHHRSAADQPELIKLAVSIHRGVAHADIIHVQQQHPVGFGESQFFQHRVWLHGRHPFRIAAGNPGWSSADPQEPRPPGRLQDPAGAPAAPGGRRCGSRSQPPRR